MTPTAKKCLVCKKPLKGRIDKKFCDDGCRNTYNNTNNSESSALVRSVNNILKKNRRIIEEQISKTGAETAKASRSKLLELGFNFKYYTNTYTTKKETVYYFCYEYGYLPIEGDWIFMVKRKEE